MPHGLLECLLSIFKERTYEMLSLHATGSQKYGFRGEKDGVKLRG